MNAMDEAAARTMKVPRKFLNSNERKAMFLFLTQKSGNGKSLPPGTLVEAATKYQCSTKLVSKIWVVGKRHKDDEQAVFQALSPKKKGRCGRKRRELPLDLIRGLSVKKRRSVRALSRNAEIPKSTLQDHLKKYDDLEKHTNSLKPDLTPQNELERLKYDLSMINPDSLPHSPEFRGFYDDIHVDEKWFELTEAVAAMILARGEPRPYRTCKSKKFVPKIMFLCANARPRFHPETGECLFDGKLGIWPFVHKVAAQRSSANRPRGTMVTKPTIVDREAYAAMLEDELLPAIVTKFPDLLSPIYIQQDNARPHIPPNDEQFLASAESMGLQLVIRQQSPNSPDQNINDLGFFRSIQSIQQEETANNVDELIAVVKRAYDEYSPETLERVWISYQACMIKCMEERGSNRYNLPHLRKGALARQGLLQRTLTIPIALVLETQQVVDNAQHVSESEQSSDEEI